MRFLRAASRGGSLPGPMRLYNGLHRVLRGRTIIYPRSDLVRDDLVPFTVPRGDLKVVLI